MNQPADLTAFADYLRAQDRAEATVQGYLADLRAFAAWFEQHTGEPLQVERVTAGDLRAYREHCLGEGCRAATVNRHLSALGNYLEWGRLQGRRADNPARALRRVKQTLPGRVRWLNAREQAALRRAVERDLQLADLRYTVRKVTRQRDAAMLLTLLYTGLRVSELIALRLDDLTLGERQGTLRVRAGKGGKQREVPLHREARRVLRAWLEVRPAVESDILFIPVENPGRPGLHVRSVQRVVRRYGQEAGLPDLTPHVLRHTFAKNLVDAGVSLEKVAALLGHSNLNTTRIYITPSPQDLQRAVEQLT